MTERATSIRAAFRPRTVAVYDASATDASKLGNTLLANAASSRLDATVAVHPGANEIDGVEAVAQLDRPVGLALISVPDPAPSRLSRTPRPTRRRGGPFIGLRRGRRGR